MASPPEYRLLVSSVTDQGSELTRDQLMDRVKLQKLELADLRESLLSNWPAERSSPSEAVSVTIIWSDRYRQKPKLGRLDKERVLAVDLFVPLAALVDSLRNGFYRQLLRWLLLKTLEYLVAKGRVCDLSSMIDDSLTELPDYEPYLLNLNG